ncbi:hypothetical protein SDC9_53747 [bioreactor metagenome]|uniref:Uncharacterized protein n=1 Tax=bioreactor metagenome TaxID=1076179 RepID=A0A644WV17_9ZZZZ
MKRINIQTLTLAAASSFDRYAFKAPGSRLISVTMLCPELFSSQLGTYMSVELAITTNQGDINLLNHAFTLGQLKVDPSIPREKRTIFLNQPVKAGQEIQGYAKVISSGRFDPTIETYVKIYFNFEI